MVDRKFKQEIWSLVRGHWPGDKCGLDVNMHLNKISPLPQASFWHYGLQMLTVIVIEDISEVSLDLFGFLQATLSKFQLWLEFGII